MQYVNDDMDELFRRAAKDYPLNTGGADWEKVQKALDEPPVHEKGTSGSTDRRHLLWLLLLLPLPWICTRFTGEGDKEAAEASASKAHTTAHIQKAPGGVAATVERSVGGTGVEKAVQPVPKTSFKASAGTFAPFSSLMATDNSSGAPLARKGAYKPSKPASLYEEGAGVKNKTPDNPYSTLPERVQEFSAPATARAEKKEAIAAPAKDSVQQDTSSRTASAPEAKKLQSPKVRRFYAGLIGGVDVTSVEMQEIKKAGYDIGGVVGYSINQRWSVEAGLLSSEKAYYSSGEHLYKAYVLPGTRLREAQGDCRMWEVPLLVRYQFAPAKKGGWFAAAGSSSYFMKKESYDYTYYYTATGQEVKRSRSYNSDSRHLFAAAQFSGGYRHQVGRTMEVRVEPYVKLPLRKVGYYELPLTSFGVHAGIIKRIR